jgi:hypothetical protein
MEMDSNKNYDIDALFFVIKSSHDIDQVFDTFKYLEEHKKNLYNGYIEKLKVLFVNSEEYEFLSTAALIFNEFKIHSTAPLLVAKLLNGNFDKNGGTFLYSLIGLRKSFFMKELQSLWLRNISWEMEQKLDLLGVSDPR